ncbi:DUF4136 domain-containing protein [Carboxylicivirga sp. A043]|uniref:DUF4136 domain-containing protein n=1 Tax=Carboxylicivirga litoralis TaxID=2816963 RepID=UPI0021CB8613|nr:DUF4136 domain-containing protein [Carboxylicivirga sp. A043]MCU4157170.1 DUF4136 domain-containing protein [Carboxylicivirga sp. A043]
MKTRLRFLMPIVLIFAVYACYPGGAEYVDELDTSISIFDDSYNWKNLDGKTYSLPEEILYVKNGEEVDDPQRIHDADILGQMRSELGALGMTEAKTIAADTSVIVAISIIEQNNSGAAWIPGGGWWGGYYPWYPDWGWGGYYPWYPVYYSYKTGSVVIEMADYENKNEAEETVPLVYDGVLDGLLQGSDKYIGDRIERGIDELFNQAPFN